MAGDRRTARPRRWCNCFNPRPPISWRATSTSGASTWPRKRFNPRPPISWRATPTPPTCRLARCCFNPRPPISWRATPLRLCGRRSTRVSIHAHQFHGGRPGGGSGAGHDLGVSIHAHQFHGGRPGLSGATVMLDSVSIHAHQFHGGRLDGTAHDHFVDVVSIHAHQFHGGRPRQQQVSAHAHPCFNPRPPISWRATDSSR